MSPNPEETADLVTFTEEILNEEFYFFCEVSVASVKRILSKYHTKHLLFRTYINTEFQKN